MAAVYSWSCRPDLVSAAPPFQGWALRAWPPSCLGQARGVVQGEPCRSELAELASGRALGTVG